MPSAETASKADTTPSNRNYAEHVPDDALKRVNEAPGNITRLRCLIDNIESRHVVDYAHVLSRADGKKNELMSNLERSWGIEPGTLNSNSHRNIFRLSAKFHRLFDEGKWLLLPETKILDEYNQHYANQGLPIDFPAVMHDSYKYTLVAHPDMKQVAIHRRTEGIEISSPSAFKTFVYPYEDFPTIVSHVHPRFIIFNSGQKLDKLLKIKAFLKGNADVDKRLKDVAKIYHNWIKPDGTPVKSKSTFAPRRVQPDRGKTLINSYAEPPEPPALLIRVPRNVCTPPRSVTSETAGEVTHDTPEKREQRQTPDKAKIKVVAAAGAEVCLIDNTNNVLEYAHLLPRNSNFATLTNLEYSWNMKFGTLNVNTHRNIFLLTKNLHRLFDANSWFLLPEESIIDRYYATREDPENFPVIASPPYKYTLVVNSKMGAIPIHRQKSCKGKVKETGMTDVDVVPANAFEKHIFPFPGFPTITSHVHPRFVLFNAGSKIADGAPAIDYLDSNPPGLETIVEKIDEIYTAWTTRRAPKEFDAAGLPYTPANDDYPDDRTASRRAPRSVKRTRATTQLPGDGSPQLSKKQKSGGGQDCAWLDDATLAELDHDPSPKKAWEEKAAWIQAWVGGVPLDAMDVDEVPMDIDNDLTDKLAGQAPDYAASISISELSS